jgi:hypothetical protein
MNTMLDIWQMLPFITEYILFFTGAVPVPVIVINPRLFDRSLFFSPRTRHAKRPYDLC